jgi:C-terminal processing protease CtpA/Prc
VLKVIDDTPADRAGLKAGDVILSIDGKSVADGDDLRRELRARDEGDVDLHIRRKGAERTIKAKLEKSELGMWDEDGNDWMGWNNETATATRASSASAARTATACGWATAATSTWKA